MCDVNVHVRNTPPSSTVTRAAFSSFSPSACARLRFRHGRPSATTRTVGWPKNGFHRIWHAVIMGLPAYRSASDAVEVFARKDFVTESDPSVTFGGRSRPTFSRRDKIRRLRTSVWKPTPREVSAIRLANTCTTVFRL